MKSILAGLVVVMAVSAFAEEQKKEAAAPAATTVKAAVGVSWVTDLEQAKKAAAEKGKTIFALFTGSDWCPWCIKMEKEILSTPEFAKYASENLVLLKLDFLRKTKVPEEQAKKHKELAEKYKIEGFPTVVLLDAAGKETGRSSYQPGGGAAFVEHLKSMKAEQAAAKEQAPAPAK